MATTYDYAQTAFPNLIANGTALEQEIDASSIDIAANPILSIDVEVSADPVEWCQITFTSALSAGDKTTLDGIVAAHQGALVVADLKGTIPAVQSEIVITEDATWQLVGCVITTPGFFVDDLSTLLGRIIGEHKGDGGQVRLMEAVTGGADEDKMNPPFDFSDTAGAWEIFKADTNVPPRKGIRNRYKVEARLNGAASLSIRFSTISMIEVRIVVG